MYAVPNIKLEKIPIFDESNRTVTIQTGHNSHKLTFPCITVNINDMLKLSNCNFSICRNDGRIIHNNCILTNVIHHVTKNKLHIVSYSGDR